MEPNDTDTNHWLQRLKTSLLADKRKTVVMAVLLVVATGMVVGALIGDNMPAKAKGQTRGTVTTPTAQPTHPPRQGLSEAYLAQLDTEVTRDLFAIEYAAFPEITDGQAAEHTPGTTAPDGDPDFVRQQHVTQIQEQARALKLQSAMPGAIPSVIINGQVVRVGQVLEGFTVQRIGMRSCELVREGVTVTLKME